MLSLPKILLLLAVLAVVVLLSKAMRGKSSADRKSATGNEAENEALDLSPCPVCGNFVAADAPRCERADCPQAV